MKKETTSAMKFYEKTCDAEGNGEFDLSASYYLMIMEVFEYVARAENGNAANTLIALSMQRSLRGDVHQWCPACGPAVCAGGEICGKDHRCGIRTGHSS